MISASTACIAREVLEAATVAALPKAVGSAFRYKDAKYADPTLKGNILKGEALTVAQVSGYSILIDRAVKFLANAAKESTKESILKTSLTTLVAKENKSLFVCALATLANYTAEKVSRMKFKRELGAINGITLKSSNRNTSPHHALDTHA